MALPALKEAYETFAAPPEIPVAALNFERTRANLRAQMSRKVKEYADEIFRWRNKLIQTRLKIQHTLEIFMPQASPEDHAAALADLQAFINIVGEQIDSAKSVIELAKTRWGARIEKLDSMPADDARFIRKQLHRGLELLYERHDRQVEFYYFLLSLIAEYDPESHDGSVFNDPDELDRHLREQLEI